MAKLVVEIPINSSSATELRGLMNQAKEAWFPTPDPSLVSVDEASLKQDPDDDSFFLFRLVDVVD